jgi:hypothetical protein
MQGGARLGNQWLESHPLRQPVGPSLILLRRPQIALSNRFVRMFVVYAYRRILGLLLSENLTHVFQAVALTQQQTINFEVT